MGQKASRLTDFQMAFFNQRGYISNSQMPWPPSQVFWHLSLSLVMISNLSGWQRILESKVPNFFEITEHKAQSFSFQGGVHSLL